MANKKYESNTKPSANYIPTSIPDVSQQNFFISKFFENVDFRSWPREAYCCRVFFGCTFKSCTFEGVFFSGCTFKSCTFENCNLIDTSWNNVCIYFTTFRGSKLINSRFKSSLVVSSGFYTCSLRFSKFDDFKFFTVEFDGSALYYAKFMFGLFLSSKIDPTIYSRGGLNLVTKPYKEMSFVDVDFDNTLFKRIDFNKINTRHCYFNRVAGFKFCKNVPYVPMTCPEEGSFIAYKKVLKHAGDDLITWNEMIAVLEIPADAKRSSGGGKRKCRCNKAKVLRFEDMDGNVLNKITEGYSAFNRNFDYRVGEYVTENNFDGDRWEACARGIHFFMNRQEAIDYDFN